MSTGVLPEAMRGFAESLERAIGRLSPAEVPADEMGPVLLFARRHTETIRLLWKDLYSDLSQGMELGQAQASGALLAAIAEAWLQVLRLVQDAGAVAARHSGNSLKGLAELANDVKILDEIGVAARELASSLGAVRATPLDQGKLLEAETAFAEGRFQKGQDVIARLRSPRVS